MAGNRAGSSVGESRATIFGRSGKMGIDAAKQKISASEGHQVAAKVGQLETKATKIIAVRPDAPSLVKKARDILSNCRSTIFQAMNNKPVPTPASKENDVPQESVTRFSPR